MSQASTAGINPGLKLESLASAAQQESGAGEFMNPVTPLKKRGRPRKDANKAETKKSPDVSEGVDTETVDPKEQIEALKPIIRPCVEMMSKAGVKIAEHEDAAMQKGEMEIVIDTMSACVHQYLPGAIGVHANLIVLSMTMANWSMRVYMLREQSLAALRARKGMPVDVPSEVHNVAH